MLKFTNTFQKMWSDPAMLSHGIRIVGMLSIAILVGFAGYYYTDRFVHVSDPTPMELAIEHLKSNIYQAPEDPDLRVALAAQYLENGETSKALDQAAQVLNVEPDNQDAIYLLGITYTQSGNYEQAIQFLSDFVVLRQENPMAGVDRHLETALYFLGDNYLALDQPDLAIPALEMALEIDHTDADALYLLGSAYERTGQVEHAVESYLDVLRFVPDYLETYQALAKIYLEQGEPSYAHFAFGGEAFSTGNYEQARDLLLAATDQLPEFSPALTLLGITYLSLEDYEQAQIYLQQALTIEPDNYLAEHALGKIIAEMDTIE